MQLDSPNSPGWNQARLGRTISAGGTSGPGSRRTSGPRYMVDPMVSNSSVRYAMLLRYNQDPEYVRAVLKSYIDIKISRGRYSDEISSKLHLLEREFPQHSRVFKEVREEYRLPPSRVFPSLQPINLHRAHTIVASYPRSPRASRSSAERPRTPVDDSALPQEFRVRTEQEQEDEPPPPPYASNDPEPDQTRILEQRLASEAERSLPPDTPATPRAPKQHAPPTSTPPNITHRPGRELSEEEQILQAREESQLEAARRASLIHEQERKDLEEAVRLSLQASPVMVYPTTEAGPSSRPGMPRPVSAYEANSALAVTPHRRVSSDASRHAEQVTQGMNRLIIPNNHNLMDQFDSAPMQPPLVPEKTETAMQSRNPFLSPNDPPEQVVSQQQHTSQPGRKRLPSIPHSPVNATQKPPMLPKRQASLYTKPAGEDPLEMLREFDTVFLVDDSTSMAGNRWRDAQTALIGVAEVAAEYDDDGVDIYFINSKRVGREIKSRDDVEEIFAGLQPKGATPTGYRLEAILRDYMARLEQSVVHSPGGVSQPQVKPLNLIVITDGAPTDDPEGVVIACAKRLDRGDFPLSQVGIQFVQIGDDPEAAEALHELDDNLCHAYGVRDIVDTIPYTGQDFTAGFIIKTLLGGINRRLDRRAQ